MSDPGPPDGPPSEPQPAAAPLKRSRITRILFLVCAIGAALVILPRIPRDRQIEFRVEDAPTVVGIDLTWSRDDGEPVQGSSWHFEPGHAPRFLTTSVHLPNGHYAIDVVVARTQGRDELHRVIELADSDHVTVPLR